MVGDKMVQRWEIILKKVYGPVTENGVWKLKRNKAAGALGKPRILGEVQMVRIRWAVTSKG